MRHMQGTEAETALITAGYVLVYRPGILNFCPGCGGTHWHIGRYTAECGYCATALPIAATVVRDVTAEPARSGWRALLPAMAG